MQASAENDYAAIGGVHTCSNWRSTVFFPSWIRIQAFGRLSLIKSYQNSPLLGRFCFNLLPFGITSTPEHFQRKTYVLLTSLEGLVDLLDDILVYGTTQEEHDKNLLAILTCLSKAGFTLNKETRLQFLGQLMDRL